MRNRCKYARRMKCAVPQQTATISLLKIAQNIPSTLSPSFPVQAAAVSPSLLCFFSFLTRLALFMAILLRRFTIQLRLFVFCHLCVVLCGRCLTFLCVLYECCRPQRLLSGLRLGASLHVRSGVSFWNMDVEAMFASILIPKWNFLVWKTIRGVWQLSERRCAHGICAKTHIEIYWRLNSSKWNTKVKTT